MHTSKRLKDYQAGKSLYANKLGTYKLQVTTKLNLTCKISIRNN